MSDVSLPTPTRQAQTPEAETLPDVYARELPAKVYRRRFIQRAPTMELRRYTRFVTG
ncbi:hypothetical protein [Primorskyibacter sp. S187A]|uniref:hypothetical protein n=1 Tax=Primorskyibacter sp. S187A TaxID=3415130 RepID=UPI003C7DDE28